MTHLTLWSNKDSSHEKSDNALTNEGVNESEKCQEKDGHQFKRSIVEQYNHRKPSALASAAQTGDENPPCSTGSASMITREAIQKHIQDISVLSSKLHRRIVALERMLGETAGISESKKMEINNDLLAAMMELNSLPVIKE